MHGMCFQELGTLPSLRAVLRSPCDHPKHGERLGSGCPDQRIHWTVGKRLCQGFTGMFFSCMSQQPAAGPQIAGQTGGAGGCGQAMPDWLLHTALPSKDCAGADGAAGKVAFRWESKKALWTSNRLPQRNMHTDNCMYRICCTMVLNRSESERTDVQQWERDVSPTHVTPPLQHWPGV